MGTVVQVKSTGEAVRMTAPEWMTEVGELQWSLRLDESGAITYVGLASPGAATSAAVWQIKRVDETAGVTILWADGNTLFDNVWNNRASLSYS